MTGGGGGLKFFPKLLDVIYECPLPASTEMTVSLSPSPVLTKTGAESELGTDQSINEWRLIKLRLDSGSVKVSL